MRASAQTNSPKSTRPLWKKVTQLGKALCCEKSFLKKGIDTHRNGWERVPKPINADIVKKYYACDGKGSNVSKLKT